jgi:hypothetical protein
MPSPVRCPPFRVSVPCPFLPPTGPTRPVLRSYHLRGGHRAAVRKPRRVLSEMPSPVRCPFLPSNRRNAPAVLGSYHLRGGHRAAVRNLDGCFRKCPALFGVHPLGCPFRVLSFPPADATRPPCSAARLPESACLNFQGWRWPHHPVIQFFHPAIPLLWSHFHIPRAKDGLGLSTQLQYRSR